MKKGKNSPERLLEETVKLDPVQFLGVCKILGVEIYKIDTSVEENDEGAESTKKSLEARDFVDIWQDLCDVIKEMNRTRRRNLAKLLYAANSKEKEDE